MSRVLLARLARLEEALDKVLLLVPCGVLDSSPQSPPATPPPCFDGPPVPPPEAPMQHLPPAKEAPVLPPITPFPR